MSRIPAGRAGFTLLELLIALLISAILVTVIFNILLGQGRFTRMTTGREEVQQNARASLELIASELRGATARSLTDAGATSIQFRQPRAWGVLCNDLTSASTTAWVRFADGVYPQDYAPLNARWGLAVGQTTNPTAAPLSWSHTVALADDPGAPPCSAAGALGAASNPVYERGFVGAGFTAATVAAGSRVYVFENVRYESDAGWLKRSIYPGGTMEMREIAGPLAADGLAFEYLDADGTAFPVPVAAANLPLVASVRVTVRMQSSGQVNGHHQEDVASTVVSFRN